MRRSLTLLERAYPGVARGTEPKVGLSELLSSASAGKLAVSNLK